MKRILVFLLLVCGISLADASPRLEFAARKGKVTVLAEPGLDREARDLADRAEAALVHIAGDLPGLPQPQAIEIRLVRESRDLAAVAPGERGAPPWAIGVAYPDIGVVSIALRRESTVVDPIPTMKHELAHIALGTALGDRAPHWLHEGFAYQHSAEWSRERVETLAGMAWMDTIIPLDELDRSFPSQELVANRAYAESYDFVGFLSRRGRWADDEDDGDRFAFRRFLQELGNGAELDTAAIRAFGAPTHALFVEWKSDLKNRYKLVPIGLLGLALWIFCALLLVFAAWRRRRQNRRRLAQWDVEERAREERLRHASALVHVPPYVPWPGKDPFEDVPDDDPPEDPRLMN
ncbi:MAG TPA: hypothetical protein VFQ53_29255 [Kofleriaceae bacterium]|nr:hypothetical protein [Kofleriaceae bacterium]